MTCSKRALAAGVFAASVAFAAVAEEPSLDRDNCRGRLDGAR
jgi:hypothetical protein